jgi:hypothetical protein
MVPLGRHALFEGELVHTNEFHVGLGADLRLEASAKQVSWRPVSARPRELTFLHVWPPLGRLGGLKAEAEERAARQEGRGPPRRMPRASLRRRERS